LASWIESIWRKLRIFLRMISIAIKAQMSETPSPMPTPMAV
jgi:hypothetical protein